MQSTWLTHLPKPKNSLCKCSYSFLCIIPNWIFDNCLRFHLKGSIEQMNTLLFNVLPNKGRIRRRNKENFSIPTELSILLFLSGFVYFMFMLICIYSDELSLICDMFYLPYEHGPLALYLLTEFDWLKANAHVLNTQKDHTKASSENKHLVSSSSKNFNF